MKTLEKRSLFWDVKSVDIEKNKNFIIERILSFGDLDDFFWALDLYGQEEFKKVLLNSRRLDKKSTNFWGNYFNLNQEEWKKVLLAQKQKVFWTR
ncbi:MAG: hypothetical protein PF549_00280 [Patescibacteria group bacterium]|jgi:hypothetical protein|nr:hypothetical protein [Patescibacteria group bacterium]